MCFIDKKRCVVAVTDFCDRLQITAKTVVRRADQQHGFRIRRFGKRFFDGFRRHAAPHLPFCAVLRHHINRCGSA